MVWADGLGFGFGIVAHRTRAAGAEDQALSTEPFRLQGWSFRESELILPDGFSRSFDKGMWVTAQDLAAGLQ